MILTPASAMELILMIGIKNFPSFNYLIPTKILRYLVHFSWYYEKTMSSLPLLTFRISKVFKSLVVEAWFHVPEFGNRFLPVPTFGIFFLPSSKHVSSKISM